MTDFLATRPAPKVIVDIEARTDAALIDRGEERLLVLHPMQTFSNAVAQITQLLPEMHPDQVRALVRLYLPDSHDFDTVESTLRSAPMPAVAVRPTPMKASAVRKVAAWLAVTSVATMAGLGYQLSRPHEVKPFSEAAFQRFATLGKMECSPVDATHARCTDVDGMVMFTSVVTSPEFTVFTFAYGTEQIKMRVFPTEALAAAWEREPTTHEMNPNLHRVGRYVFYGTDPDRLNEYAQLVADGQPGHNGRGRGATVAMVDGVPVRLVSLAFGALNLPDDVKQATPAQAHAATMVMGKKPPKTAAVAKPVQVKAAKPPKEDPAVVEAMVSVPPLDEILPPLDEKNPGPEFEPPKRPDMVPTAKPTNVPDLPEQAKGDPTPGAGNPDPAASPSPAPSSSDAPADQSLLDGVTAP